MKKILYVAQREFLATAGTKAFIFGILVTPLVIGVLILLIPWMSRQDPPAIAGTVAVIDPTGQVTAGLAASSSPRASKSAARRPISASRTHALRAALCQRHERPRGGGGSTGAGLDARQGAAATG